MLTLITESTSMPYSHKPKPKPKPNKLRPKPTLVARKVVLTFPPLREKGAKTTINNEFKIPNQVAGTSVSVELNSLPTFQRTIPQIITKQ
jgi:hypothetical protein